MNGYDHVRALLYAYPMAERLAEAVKEGARVRACLSFRSPRNTLSVMESIAADVEYAECLLEWKSRLDRVLSHCSDEELFLLEYKYFRRRKQLKAWEERVALSCSERSYFRKQKEVLERVSRRLARRGGTREAFLKDFEGFSPLMRILSALESGAERRLVEQRRGGNLLKDQNSSPSAAAEGALRPRSTKKAMAATARMPKISAAISMPESAEEAVSSSAGSSSAGAETSVR